MNTEKEILRGLDGLDKRLKILKKLKNNEVVEGLELCSECNGSGFGEDGISMCKKCYGDGFIMEKIKKLL